MSSDWFETHLAPGISKAKIPVLIRLADVSAVIGVYDNKNEDWKRQVYAVIHMHSGITHNVFMTYDEVVARLTGQPIITAQQESDPNAVTPATIPLHIPQK